MTKLTQITSIERAIELFAASGNKIGYYHSRWPELGSTPDEYISKGAFGLFKFTYEECNYIDEEDCYDNKIIDVFFTGILEEFSKHHIAVLFEYEGKLYAKDSNDLYMDDEASFEEYKNTYNSRSYVFCSELSKIKEVVKFG